MSENHKTTDLQDLLEDVAQWESIVVAESLTEEGAKLALISLSEARAALRSLMLRIVMESPLFANRQIPAELNPTQSEKERHLLCQKQKPSPKKSKKESPPSDHASVDPIFSAPGNSI